MVTSVVTKIREYTCKSYTIKHKRSTVHAIWELVDSQQATNIASACRHLNVDRRHFYRWKKLLEGEGKPQGETSGSTSDSGEATDSSNMSVVSVASLISSKKLLRGHLRTLHPGRLGMLASHEHALMRFVFEFHEQGIQVTTRMVRKFAEKIVPDFHKKTHRVIRSQVVRRFLRRIGLTHRAGTHVAQTNNKNSEAASREFMEVMRQKVQNMNPDHVLNMDQTPIPFTFHANRTWSEKGMRTVHIRASTSDTKRATLAATVTMSGDLLPPFLIFKGAENGRIATKELPTYPEMCCYAMQKKAWMDEAMMMKWIDVCLKPWKNTLPPMVVPLLILDSFRVHMMGPVVETIQRLGIEVQYIPGGCTYLCQPIDVGVNRPLKKAVENLWEDWMYDEVGENGGEVATPSREMIATWVSEVYWMIDQEVCKNAWKKEGFEWVIN